MRQYLTKRRVTDIRQANLLALAAVGTDRSDKNWLGQVDSVLKKYVDSLLGVNVYEENAEQRMREEYERVRRHNPRLYLNSDGQATVEGVS